MKTLLIIVAILGLALKAEAVYCEARSGVMEACKEENAAIRAAWDADDHKFKRDLMKYYNSWGFRDCFENISPEEPCKETMCEIKWMRPFESSVLEKMFECVYKNCDCGDPDAT